MTTSTRVRLSPEERRAQLLDLGVRLLATRSLDELSIDVLAEEAGISRGLLYHYFGNKHAFHEAVVRRAADDLIAQTAPPASGEPYERLAASVAAYVDYVVANHEGYLSLVRSAAGGNPALRDIYDECRAALTDRLFTEDPQAEMIADTPLNRLVARGWSAMTEEVVLAWVAEPGDVTRQRLLELLAISLPTMIDATSRT